MSDSGFEPLGPDGHGYQPSLRAWQGVTAAALVVTVGAVVGYFTQISRLENEITEIRASYTGPQQHEALRISVDTLNKDIIVTRQVQLQVLNRLDALEKDQHDQWTELHKIESGK